MRIMDNGLQFSFMALIIGYTCVGLFVATAFAVVLDLFGFKKLKADIRGTLHKVLLVEVVAISLGWLSGVLKFDAKNVQDQIVTKVQEKVTEEIKVSTVQPLEQKIIDLEKPKAFIQIADESQRTTAEDLQQNLKNRGFTVPEIENVGVRAPKSAEVRYSTSNPQSKVNAIQIADEVKAAGQPETKLKGLGDTKASKGNVEIWFPKNKS